MSGKKNVLSYFIIVIYILLNIAMVIGRIFYYNPSSQHDISKVCIIISIPVLFIILFIISGIIVRAISDSINNNKETITEAERRKYPYIIVAFLLLTAGVIARLYFALNCPDMYINNISDLYMHDSGSVYSYLIRAVVQVTGDNGYTIICINVILSILLMLLIYMFSCMVISYNGACIVLLLVAVSPYELVRCVMYSPNLLYVIFIFLILNVFTAGYKRFKINNTKELCFTFIMILSGILCGLFLLITPIAIPLILALFLFSRFKVKDILQSFLFMLIAAVTYFGIIHIDMYIIPVAFIENIHKTADIILNINFNNSLPDYWKNFALLCSGEPLYNNHILNNYIEDCIWMFLNITSVTGALIMLKRERSYSQLLMKINIFTILLCMLISYNSETKAIFYTLYSIYACFAGYTIYNIYNNPAIVTSDAPGIHNIPDTPDTLGKPDTLDIHDTPEVKVINDTDNNGVPEPIRISDIIPATQTAGEYAAADENTTDNTDIINLLPVPRQIMPYGEADKSIIVRDYQECIRGDMPKDVKWENRKMRTLNKSKHNKE